MSSFEPLPLTRGERLAKARMAEAEHRARLDAERAAAAVAAKLALAEGRAALAAKTAETVAAASPVAVAPKDDGAPEETVRARLARQVLVTLDATMAELGSADPKDRASILSLAAKVSGMLAVDTDAETRPFTLRGFAPCEPVPVKDEPPAA